MQGCGLPRVPRIRVGSAVEQLLHCCRILVEHDCLVQKRPFQNCTGFYSYLEEQSLDHRWVLVEAGRVMQGCVLPLVPCVRVGTSLEQSLDHRWVLVEAGRVMQGCVLVIVS